MVHDFANLHEESCLKKSEKQRQELFRSTLQLFRNPRSPRRQLKLTGEPIIRLHRFFEQQSTAHQAAAWLYALISSSGESRSMHSRALWRCAQTVKSGMSRNTAAVETCNRLSGSSATCFSSNGLPYVRANSSGSGTKAGQQAVSNALLVDTLDMVSNNFAYCFSPSIYIRGP